MEASLRKASDVVATLLNRRSGGGGGDVETPREPELPRDWPEQLPFRKRPKPYSRAIAWTPGTPTARPDGKRSYELFVSQSVLRQVRGHLLMARSGEPYGFLLGQVVYCPWSESPYIVIDAVRREPQNLPPANDMDRFRHAWVAASRDARHRRGEVIGWYHRHGVLGLRLSEWDLHLQEEFFPEAWHCALIVASTSKGIIGGFIQRSPRARLFRKGLAPFHELVDLDAKLVDGRKPSLVDWENYGASEPVSVLKAKWPAPRTRLERWKAPDHASEGDPASGTDGAATPRPSAGSRGLRGRSWRTAGPPKKTDRRSRRREEEFSEEEFTGAVGPGRRASREPGAVVDAPAPDVEAEDEGRTKATGAPDADVADETVVEPPPESAAEADAETQTEAPPTPKRRGARKGKARKRPPAKEEPAAEDPADEADRPADGKPEDGPGDDAVEPAASGVAVDGAWYSSEFAEAVWGELPFALEAPEVSTDETEERARHAATRSGEGTDEAPSGAPRAGTVPATPRFELVSPFEPEPAETIDEDQASLAWVLSLVGETLARARTREESSPEPRETGDGERAPDAAADATATERAADPGPDERDEASAVAPAERPARARPPLATPSAGKRRKTFVSTSHDPDHDREAEIPVVLFHESERWRPSPRLLRIAAVVAIVAIGALALRVMWDRGPAIPPPAPAAQPPSIADGARPTPEFIELADAYLSSLQTYRQRVVQHGLGQVDCAQLTEDFSAVVLSHRTLARYVDGNPSLAERFDGLDSEMGPARQRFEASECPLPPELAPRTAPSDSPDGSSPAD